MNLNERVLPHGESICFVGKFGLIFRLLGAVSAILNKTNASAAPKIQFIEVHLLHSVMITRTLLYKLMNLMNFNELRYYLRLLFAMDKRARHVFWLGQVHQGSFGSLKKVMTMRKIFFLLSALILTGCGSQLAVQAAALGTPEAQRSATPVATATETITPSPTVDWKGTAIVAQATADEARRLDTQATAAYEQRLHDESAWTAQADVWTAQSNQATATAYGTSVPLTGTARSEDLTAISGYMTMTSGQMTAVKEAPTQSKAMTDARIYEEHGETDFIIRMFVLAALGVFLFGIGVFAFGAKPKAQEAMSVPATQRRNEPDLIPLRHDRETVVKVKTDNGQGFGQEILMTVPCTREQLTELADGVINGGMTLGVNNWEGDKTLLTRAVIGRLRHFFEANKMANKDAGGRVSLNERGMAFLHAWIRQGVLPHSYTFPQSESTEPFGMSHEHDAHAIAHGGGA